MNRWIKFPNCATCEGYGWVYGGDEPQQCPECRLREAARLRDVERARHSRRIVHHG